MEDRRNAFAGEGEWRVVDERDMPGHLDAAIRQGLCRAMPEEAAFFAHSRAWNGCAPAFSVVLLREGGDVVAHVGVVDRVVAAGERDVRVAGVQNVFVSPDARGGGFGKEAMRLAMAEAGRRGFDCGMLFCLPRLEAYYASLGWRALEGRRVRVGGDGEDRFPPQKNIAMYLPMAVNSFPAGAIHLRGNDW